MGPVQAAFLPQDPDRLIPVPPHPDGRSARRDVPRPSPESRTAMIKSILLVGLGSCAGGILRYLVSLVLPPRGSGFPTATFIVNIAGCLLIGLLYGLFSKYSETPSALCLLLTTGLCGGFTTFSTFSNEAVAMLQGCDNAPGREYPDVPALRYRQRNLRNTGYFRRVCVSPVIVEAGMSSFENANIFRPRSFSEAPIW